MLFCLQFRVVESERGSMGCVNSARSSSSGPISTVEEEETYWDIIETTNIEFKQLLNDEYVNEYKLLEVLGRGSYGLVRKCERTAPKTPPPYRKFAIKFLRKSKLCKMRETLIDDDGVMVRVDGLQRLQSEINVMRHLYHRNICLLFEVRW